MKKIITCLHISGATSTAAILTYLLLGMHEAGYVSDSIHRRILPYVKYIEINTCFLYPAEQNNTQILHLWTAATTRWLQLWNTVVL